jgi:hypothetical protein
MKQLTVRAGKGDKDRFTTFPAALTPLLQNHLAGVKTLHQQDLAQGHGESNSCSMRREIMLVAMPPPRSVRLATVLWLIR